MKALGQEIFDFVNSEWPEGYYMDCEIETHNEDLTIALNPIAKYDLGDFESVYNKDGEAVITFAALFKKWKTSQTCVTAVVNIPKEKFDEVMVFLKSNSCTVIK